ncbi:MAG: DoxX family protein [bacterium]|nr:DoxX family protein [bacterium]
MNKLPKISGWILAVLLGGMFLVSGAGKLMTSDATMFVNWGYTPWFMKLIGGLEVLGGIGLLVPMTTRLAIYGLTIIMLGAVYTHINAGEGINFIRPTAFLIFLWALWWLRRPRPVVES